MQKVIICRELAIKGRPEFEAPRTKVTRLVFQIPKRQPIPESQPRDRDKIPFYGFHSENQCIGGWA